MHPGFPVFDLSPRGRLTLPRKVQYCTDQSTYITAIPTVVSEPPTRRTTGHTMRYDDLLVDIRDGIARISINRPARRNALGDSTTRQLVAACGAAGERADVRALVITGEGEAFCAGGDFKDTFERGAGQTAAQWSERIRRGPNELVRLLQGLAQPVIASVNGAAVGGGATIALACDLRIASDRARFGFPFARLGISPEFGCSHLLPRVVGLGRAMELLLLADLVSAKEALALGLVNRVVPHAQLAESTDAVVGRLLAMPPAALGRIKRLLHAGLERGLTDSLEHEAQELGQAFTSAEHRAAVTRFLESRPSASSAAGR